MSGTGYIGLCHSCMACTRRYGVTPDGDSGDTRGTGWARGVTLVGNKGGSVGLGVGKGVPLAVAAKHDFSVGAGAVAKGFAIGRQRGTMYMVCSGSLQRYTASARKKSILREPKQHRAFPVQKGRRGG